MPSTGTLQRLLPVLVRIQARLDDDLSLNALAEDAGLSPFHFHRLFKEFTGETPKHYCQRLRLERAALRLAIHRDSILDIALDSGYRSHETFIRAFRRRFEISPREYRQRRRFVPSDSAEAASTDAAELHQGCEVSATRVREMGELPVAFLRHVGPYEEVPQELWDRLLDWAADTGLGAGRPGSRILLGIAHDPPGITPPDRLRFDAAIGIVEPFEATGEVGCQILPGGPHGVTTHIGPYATLEQAYRAGFDRLARLRRYHLQGLPALEIYHATRINADYALNQTDVCLPLRVR